MGEVQTCGACDGGGIGGEADQPATGDKTPTCPSCDVKMVRKNEKAESFLGVGTSREGAEAR